MGIGGISVWQLLIILLIVVVIFGPKRIKNIGSDLGHALKSFRSAVNDPEKEEESSTAALENKESNKDDAKFKEEDEKEKSKVD